MQEVYAGIVMAAIGILIGVWTYKKPGLYWNNINTRLLRKVIGDRNTVVSLYTVSLVLTAVGILLSAGVLH